LGDDRVHREVLAWVKEWDWCVFGKSKGKKTAKDNDYQDFDEYRRPREKVINLGLSMELALTELRSFLSLVLLGSGRPLWLIL
jgi:hypothetical protein